MNSWMFFKRYLFSKKSNSLIRKIAYLSIIGVSIGVSALVIIMSVMGGLNESIHERILSIEPHLVIAPLSGTDLQSNPLLSADDSKIDESIKMYQYQKQDIIVRSIEGRFQGAIAKGMTEESLAYVLKQMTELQNNLIKKGEHRTLIEYGVDDIPQKNEVILGVGLARVIGVFEGDPIYVITPDSLLLPPGQVPRYEQMIVKRIIQTNVSQIDEGYLFYIQGKAMTNTTQNSVESGYEVWLKKISQLSGIERRVDKNKWKMSNWQERNSALFLALRLEKIMIGTFLTLATLIASFSIISVLSLLISQKKEDIAILQVIGISAMKTKKIFTELGFILGGIGLGLGVLLGSAITLYLEKYPLNILPDIYYDSQIPAHFSIMFIIAVLIIGSAIIFFGATLPTGRILKMQLVEVIRKKI